MKFSSLARLILSTLFYLRNVCARHSMAGRLFVLTTPWLRDEKSTLSLYVMALEHVYVNVSTPWIKGVAPLGLTVGVDFGVPKSVLINRKYQAMGETGTKFSYVCVGTGLFTLTVIMTEGETNIETMQVLPVSEWGNSYYAYTLTNQPSVQIVTAEGPNIIQINIKQSNKHLFYEIYYKLYGNDQSLEIELRQQEAFALSVCRSREFSDGSSLTGTHIQGYLPVGVVSGNCRGTTAALKCTVGDKSIPGKEYDGANVASEMLLPVTMYGTEFILIEPIGRTSPAIVVVMSVSNGTKIHVSQEQGEAGAFSLEELQTVELKSENIGLCLLTSNKPIQVVLVQRSHCIPQRENDDEFGNPSICLMRPINLFYDTYLWSYIQGEDEYRNFMGLVVEEDAVKLLELNDNDPLNVDWKTVVGKNSWKSGWVKIPISQVYVRSRNQRTFGCYFLSLAYRTSFMHTGGLITKMDGGWSDWTEWVCMNNCSGGIRKRFCNKPIPEHGGKQCPGPGDEIERDKCPDTCSRATPTSFGKMFIIALPGVFTLMERIFFILCTVAPKNAQVHITTPWFSEAKIGLNENLTVIKEVPTTYEINTSYISNVETGKKFTYKFESLDYFTLSSLIWFSKWSIASLQAIPIDAWGRKYFVATISGGPSIQIVTAEGPNNVMITIRMTNPKKLEYMYEDRKILDGQAIRVVLEAEQGFSLAQCLTDSEDKGGLTGTKLEAVLPVGVVAGNCDGRTETLYCYYLTRVADRGFTDVTAEMQMPVEMYGKDFITVNSAHRLSTGLVFVVAGESDTTVHEARSTPGLFKKHILHLEGDMIHLNITARRIMSDKGILVVYIQRSACYTESDQTAEMGDASISLLVPTTLFMDSYMWSMVMPPLMNPELHVIIVAEKINRNSLLYDYGLVINAKWTSVLGHANWLTTTLFVLEGSHIMKSVIQVPFGCYIYGQGHKYGFMNSAGYLAARINSGCNSSRESMVAADLIDNDCDGQIDEEVLNYRDDDNDSRVDEDLMGFRRVDGHWGQWTAWICVPNCTMRVKYRLCNNPLPLNGGEDCPGDKDAFDYTGCKNDCIADQRRYDYLVDGSWSQWSEWHCGQDYTENRHIRIRTCTDPPPKVGGRTCFGYSEEFTSGNCRQYWREIKEKEREIDEKEKQKKREQKRHATMWPVYLLLIFPLLVTVFFLMKKSFDPMIELVEE